MKHNVLFRTVHGSRLYGLSHEGSDHDYYTVVEKVKTKKAKFSTHKIVDDLDSVVVDLTTWMNFCTKGVPQALEAMFSQMAEVDRIGPLRTGFHVGTDEVLDRYLRTIKSFALQDDFKHKRHALRLALNMKGIRERGRFNPTLGRVEIALINSLAKLPSDAVYNDALALAWS